MDALKTHPIAGKVPGKSQSGLGPHMEVFALRLLWRLSRWLGPERASDIGAKIMSWHYPVFTRTKNVRANLEIMLADEPEERRDRRAREIVANFGRVLAEYPHLERIMTTELANRVEFCASRPRDALTPERPPAIYVGAHQANWEVLSALSAPLGKPMTIVVAPRPNPAVDALVRGARTMVEQVGRDQATRGLLRSLQNGRSVGLLADHRFDSGQLVPFFGQQSATAIGAARIALKFGCDLVPTRIERVGKVRFKITTYPPVQPLPGILDEQDRAIDMMRQVNQYFERWIRERPEQWICLKRRWPKPAQQAPERATSPCRPGSKISALRRMHQPNEAGCS